jgi:hypothetical protein
VSAIRAAGACGAAYLAVVACAWGTAPPRYLEKPYSDAVHDLRACLKTVSPSQRRLAIRRSGIGPGDPVSMHQVAAELHMPVAAVPHAEWSVVRAMRKAKAAGRCQATPVTASSRPTPKTTPQRTASRASFVPSAPEWKDPAIVVLLGVAAVSLLGIVRELVRVSR